VFLHVFVTDLHQDRVSVLEGHLGSQVPFPPLSGLCVDVRGVFVGSTADIRDDPQRFQCFLYGKRWDPHPEVVDPIAVLFFFRLFVLPMKVVPRNITLQVFTTVERIALIRGFICHCSNNHPSTQLSPR
jgi:hypothetical protein